MIRLAKRVLPMLSCALLVAASVSAEWKFDLLGPGGGGTFLSCGGSTVDPKFMLCACDMTGCYRSWDGGHAWTLIPWRDVNSSSSNGACLPSFHPKNANIAVWRNSITRDKGLTWQPMFPGRRGPWGLATDIHYNACSGDEPPAAFIGTDAGVWGSSGDLKAWKQLASGPCGGIEVLPDGTAFAATGKTLYRWTALKTEPQAVETSGLSGAVTALAAGGTTAKHVLHAVSGGGLFTSVDLGRTWKKTLAQGGLTQVVMAPNQTDVAWAGDTTNVWVTKDGGATWTNTFHYGKNAPHTWIQRDMFWSYAIQPRSLGCGQANVATVATQAELFITPNGGETWEPRHGKELGAMPDGSGAIRQEGAGAETTASYDYIFDPNDPKRHYITFGDFGLVRSMDAGTSWAWALKSKGCPWKNSCYDLAFDPFHKGRVFGAFSSLHELMHWIGCTAPNGRGGGGGVCVSNDYGAEWQVLGKGLPGAACTAVVVDAKNSKPDALVLYAGVWGHGVYKSTDSGATWKETPGVGRPGNMDVMHVRIHPKTGDLYANTSANRNGSTFPVAGGLWKSTDGGATWTELTKGLSIHWLNDFAVDADDPNLILLTGADIPAGAEGGVYRTTDGGKTWTHVLDGKTSYDGFFHGLFITINPYEPKVAYFGSTGGLWISSDAGVTWRISEKIPFKVCHRVRIDPTNHNVMYVTTDGCGVIRCPTLHGNPGD